MAILGGIVKKRLLVKLTYSNRLTVQLENPTAHPKVCWLHFWINIYNISP